MFNRSKKLTNKAKGLAKKGKKVQAFFSDPKNVKLTQQVMIAWRSAQGMLETPRIIL